MAAYSNELFLSPDLWHSITVDVRMGTMSKKMHRKVQRTLVTKR